MISIAALAIARCAYGSLREGESITEWLQVLGSGAIWTWCQPWLHSYTAVAALGVPCKAGERSECPAQYLAHS